MQVRVMKEIRLRWVAGDKHIAAESATRRPCGGLWHPDTPENRRKLEQDMADGNEIYGAGTHWIEEREA